MANFARVQVDFGKAARVRRVTVTPDSEVQAIFLNGAEREIMPNLEPRRVEKAPKGFLIESQVASPNGDETPVCYLVNGELLCW